jgi:hypothetical protein
MGSVIIRNTHELRIEYVVSYSVIIEQETWAKSGVKWEKMEVTEILVLYSMELDNKS